MASLIIHLSALCPLIRPINYLQKDLFPCHFIAGLFSWGFNISPSVLHHPQSHLNKKKIEMQHKKETNNYPGSATGAINLLITSLLFGWESTSSLRWGPGVRGWSPGEGDSSVAQWSSRVPLSVSVSTPPVADRARTCVRDGPHRPGETACVGRPHRASSVWNWLRGCRHIPRTDPWLSINKRGSRFHS